MGDTCGFSVEAVASPGSTILDDKLMRGGCMSGGVIDLSTRATGVPGTSCDVPGGSVGRRRVS